MIEVLERIDDWCVEFEKGWLVDELLIIELVFGDDMMDVEYEVFLVEFVVLEVDYCRC